jgi:hypothetical protein
MTGNQSRNWKPAETRHCTSAYRKSLIVRLRNPSIDRLTESQLPDAFRRRGNTIEDWRTYLDAVLTGSCGRMGRCPFPGKCSITSPTIGATRPTTTSARKWSRLLSRRSHSRISVCISLPLLYTFPAFKLPGTVKCPVLKPKETQCLAPRISANCRSISSSICEAKSMPCSAPKYARAAQPRNAVSRTLPRQWCRSEEWPLAGRRYGGSKIPQSRESVGDVGRPRLETEMADSRSQRRQEAGTLLHRRLGENRRGQNVTRQGAQGKELDTVAGHPGARVG